MPILMRFERDPLDDAFLWSLMDRIRSDYEAARNREESSPSIDEDEDWESIKVLEWELYPESNCKRHRTDRYEMGNSLVLRRGQKFYLAIRLNRAPDMSKDIFKLEFSFGPNPILTKGTKVVLAIRESKFTRPTTKWDARLDSIDATYLVVEVQIPATVGVGVWLVRLMTSQSQQRQTKTFECPKLLYIIFNPWCKEDPCYMPNEVEREEYVLNDAGKIFVGAYNQPKGRRWIYGQFSKAVLPACMYMLDRSKLDYTARANPMKVVRAIAAMVNSKDDDGVIVGNWTGKYEGGKAPWMWTGSAAILEEYLLKNGRPVKFGQCWVFAGVATAVCRALGIPCRTVTNFVSAHDTDESLTIDKYFNEEGEEMPGRDSVWNFHVWNDCWMARPDLPMGYGGWQAFDATPQETSEGIYRAGPASLEAIRRGQIGFMYDCPFIFSEVNADVVHWQRDEETDLGWRRMNTNKYHIGRLVLTKKVGVEDDEGDTDAENIIDQYKNKEGTLEERMIVLNALRNGGLGFLYDLPSEHSNDVELDLVDIESVMIGQPFDVTVTAWNTSRSTRTVAAQLSTSSVFYTGVNAHVVKRDTTVFELPPGHREVVRMRVTPKEYLDKLVEYSMMKIYALATVKETVQTWAEEDDFYITKPTLSLEVPDRVHVGETFKCTFRFTNPLPQKLENCSFTIEGPGLSDPVVKDYRVVQPLEKVEYTVTLKPKRAGPRKLVAVFNSKQLIEVQGAREIIVLPYV